MKEQENQFTPNIISGKSRDVQIGTAKNSLINLTGNQPYNRGLNSTAQATDFTPSPYGENDELNHTRRGSKDETAAKSF